MELSLAEAARILGVSERTLYWRARRGEVPAHLVGERYRFNQVELLDWATQNSVAQLAPPGTPGAEPVGLSAALARGGIHRDLKAADRHASLQALVERLPLSGPSRETLLELVASREDLDTTAVGGGIALPHPRQPIVLGRGEPLAALGLLSTPVDFHAPDGQPVTALLMLISPTARIHLALLREAARAFGDPRIRTLVTEPASDAVILDTLAGLEAGQGRHATTGRAGEPRAITP